MIHNVLFNYLEEILLKSDTEQAAILGKHAPKLSQNVERKDYFLIDLNPQAIVLADTYRLVKHHVSVYKDEDESKAVLSQYHYTAEFKDKEDKLYRLHVYFNGADKLATQPIFSKITAEGMSPVDSKALNQQLIDLAIENIQPLIPSLRKSLNQSVKKIELEYKKLATVAETLSADMLKNHEKYIQQLTAICETLEQLFPLVNGTHYLAIWGRVEELTKSGISR